MVSPDDILEAVDALPLEESWDLIRSYLDEGGDIDDLSADGITILNHFLKDFEMDDEAGLGFVRFLLESGADVNHRAHPPRRDPRRVCEGNEHELAPGHLGRARAPEARATGA